MGELVADRLSLCCCRGKRYPEVLRELSAYLLTYELYRMTNL